MKKVCNNRNCSYTCNHREVHEEQSHCEYSCCLFTKRTYKCETIKEIRKEKLERINKVYEK